jgi:hypothetical protein
MAAPALQTMCDPAASEYSVPSIIQYGPYFSWPGRQPSPTIVVRLNAVIVIFPGRYGETGEVVGYCSGSCMALTVYSVDHLTLDEPLELCH